jgi:phosphoglycerol transferase
VIIALAFATTGGISALVAWTITPLLRDSGRMAIFIALLSLAGLALVLDRAGLALRRRWRVPPIVLASAIGLLVTVAVFDQTSWKMVPKYAVNEGRWRMDQAFVDQIEGILPSKAAVFQLPYLPFPESRPVFGLGDSGHFAGYVHSDDLRWSYASMRGRKADWQATLADRPINEVVPAIVAAGFEGLWIDRSGYSDRAASATADLREVLGYGPAAERADGQALFWDLRAYAADLRGRQSSQSLALLAAASLEPVRWMYAKGFHEREVASNGSFRWASAAIAELQLENPSSRTRDSLLRMELARPGGTPAFVIVTFPNGEEKTLLAKPEGTEVSEPLRIPPGTSTLRLHVNASPLMEGPEGRALYVQVKRLQIVDPATLAIR